MRFLCGLAGGLFLTVSGAAAYENYVPLGTGYSTEIDSVAELNTTRDKVTVQSDIIETELYWKERENRIRDSHMNRFFSETESSGSDFSIDY
jgi:hypothetical protein